MRSKYKFTFLFVALGIILSFVCTSCNSNNDSQQGLSYYGCPVEGETRSVSLQSLNRLKNRSVFPEAKDFDSTITLEKILQPGDDHDRWSSYKAAEITGYVVDVKIGGVETCNCKAKDADHRDTHIELLLDPNDLSNNKKMIVEVTPRIRRLMSEKNEDWSTRRLRDKILGRWIQVKGWMLFDEEHSTQAENTNPGNPKNWRATCWEIHPVTSIEVISRPR